MDNEADDNGAANCIPYLLTDPNAEGPSSYKFIWGVQAGFTLTSYNLVDLRRNPIRLAIRDSKALQTSVRDQENYNQKKITLRQLPFLSFDKIYQAEDLEDEETLDKILKLFYMSKLGQEEFHTRINPHIIYDKLPKEISNQIKARLKMKKADSEVSSRHEQEKLLISTRSSFFRCTANDLNFRTINLSFKRSLKECTVNLQSVKKIRIQKNSSQIILRDRNELSKPKWSCKKIRSSQYLGSSSNEKSTRGNTTITKTNKHMTISNMT